MNEIRLSSEIDWKGNERPLSLCVDEFCISKFREKKGRVFRQRTGTYVPTDPIHPFRMADIMALLKRPAVYATNTEDFRLKSTHMDSAEYNPLGVAHCTTVYERMKRSDKVSDGSLDCLG